MIRLVGLAALALLLLLIPSPLQADSGISTLDSSVEIDFPSELVFNFEAESSANITDVRLHYQVDKMNYAEVTGEGWPDFTPGTTIETSWTWDMRKASLPPGAAVTYWWTAEDTAGNTLETPPGSVYFDDVRYPWQSLTSDEVTLLWYEGSDSFARELMDACKRGLDRLEPICYWGAANAEASPMPITIYVYASTAAVRGAMIFPQEWTGGAAFTDFGIIVIGIAPDRVDWGKRALVHELTHVVVHETTFSPYCALPVWVDEGLAMYNEGQLEPFFQAWLNNAVAEDKLISVRSLCSPFSAETEKAYVSYAESYSLVEYLMDGYGQGKMLELLGLFKQGETCDAALTQVYGFDTDGLDSRWRETLANPTAIGSQAWHSHPALIAVFSALATALVLAGALALEDWTWRRSRRRG
jgi:hypothetical protein